MANVNQQIQSASDAISRNIETLVDHRALLAQNILAQLRNLVESVAVRLHTNSPDAPFSYNAVGPAMDFVKSRAKYNFLGSFHKLLQKSVSHYTLDGDASERLMLKYYEYLYRIRRLLEEECSVKVLANLEEFPVDLDPSLREYHEKIVARIDSVRSTRSASNRYRYYIHKTRPFFVGGRIFYEVTFYRAVNKVSKFDRIIAFTHIDMTDKYAAMLTLERDSIEILGQTMPIIIILGWEVSIRPCEFDNFGRILGINQKLRTNSKEYHFVMNWLTVASASLLDFVDMPEERYLRGRAAATAGSIKPQIFPILDVVRRIVNTSSAGSNVLRYLLLRMHNQILKPQYSAEVCRMLSGLRLKFGCIPFDTMPFCTSLPDHNPRYWDLVESLDLNDRTHELLARRVKNNVERDGVLYTPLRDLEQYGDVGDLIATYNEMLYYKHKERHLILDKGHVFIEPFA